MAQMVEVTITATGTLGRTLSPRVLTKETVSIKIDADDDSRPGGRKAQEGDIENQVVDALNRALLALERDRA